MVQHPPFEEKACDLCHDTHASEHAGLLVASQQTVCGGCHSDAIPDPETSASAHAPVADGDCSGCHLPHQGKLAGLLPEADGAICMTCHTDLRDRLASGTVHAPADGECLGCHLPHQSGFESLLAQGVPDGCLECHDGDDAAFLEVHLNISGGKLDCRKCHDPHVSTEEGLMQQVTHDPFVGGGCEMCHPAAAEGEGGGR
jgi:predicted CXXCH cytochrome family protein